MMNKADSSPEEGAADSIKRKAGDDHDSERISGGSLPKRSRPGRSQEDGLKLNAEAKLTDSPEGKKADSVVNLLFDAKKAPKQATVAGELAKLNVDRNGVPIVAEDGVTFPERLMELIMNETDKESLWWQPDGNAFCINSKKFTKTILANNFQGSKFESFTRKLARWGFTRVSSPETPANTFVFRHNLFKKSQPELAKDISGSKKKQLNFAAIAAKKPTPKPASPTETSGLTARSPAPWSAFNSNQESTTAAGAVPPSHNHNLNAATLNTIGGTHPLSSHQSLFSSQLQPHLEKQLLLQSMMNSLNAPRSAAGVTQGQLRNDAFLAASMRAQQDRNRAFSRVSTASRPMELASTLQGLEAAQGGGRGLFSGLQVPSFLSESQNLSNMHQQHQQQQQANISQASNTGNTSSGTGVVDPLVRLYLQQQNQHQENLLLQQELLRQELLRREREQRDNEGRR